MQHEISLPVHKILTNGRYPKAAKSNSQPYVLYINP